MEPMPGPLQQFDRLVMCVSQSDEMRGTLSRGAEGLPLGVLTQCCIVSEGHRLRPTPAATTAQPAQHRPGSQLGQRDGRPGGLGGGPGAGAGQEPKSTDPSRKSCVM